MTLIEVTDDDFEAMLRGACDVRPGLHQPPGGVDEPAVLEHVRRLAKDLRSGGYRGGHWMMVVHGEVVGLCGIKTPPSPEGEVEIGYGVAASRRRRGHAAAAIRSLVDLARADAEMRTVVAVTFIDNIASQRVLERNGFIRVADATDSRECETFVWRLEV